MECWPQICRQFFSGPITLQWRRRCWWSYQQSILMSVHICNVIPARCATTPSTVKCSLPWCLFHSTVQLNSARCTEYDRSMSKFGWSIKYEVGGDLSIKGWATSTATPFLALQAWIKLTGGLSSWLSMWNIIMVIMTFQSSWKSCYCKNLSSVGKYKVYFFMLDFQFQLWNCKMCWV